MGRRDQDRSERILRYIRRERQRRKDSISGIDLLGSTDGGQLDLNGQDEGDYETD